ncbi:MAG: tyrosine-type recombinase/integrase, partial [Spirochaetota bacterium]
KSYHLYARPNAKDPNRVWWYWCWEMKSETVDGKPALVRKRARASTGKRTKSEAVAFVEALSGATGDTFAEFSRGFFEPNTCPYLRYKKERGGVREHTRLEHLKNLRDYLLPLFGTYRLADLNALVIEAGIHSLRRVSRAKKPTKKPGSELSRSTKDGIWRTMKIVMEEAVRHEKIRAVPLVRLLRGKTGSRKRNTLTRAEVRKLFPDSLTELGHVWTAASLHANGAEQTGREGRDRHGLLFGILFRTMLHAGLRPGEARALSKRSIIAEKNLILVEQAYTVDGELGDPKKSDDGERRVRLVQVPKSTMDMLTWWAETVEGELLFTMDDREVSKDYLVDRFRIGLANAGIDPGGRQLVPYSLRYTYRSRLEGHIDNETIREWMGHRDEEISEHYLEITADSVEGWADQQSAVDALWR